MYTFRLDAVNGETLYIKNWEPAFNHESTHTGYYTKLLVTVLIVPLVTVCILQTITLLRLQDDKMESCRTSFASQQHKKRTEINTAEDVCGDRFGFALCWLPFIAFQFLLLYFPSSIPHCSLGFTIFTQFAFLFALCHCIVNPRICFKFICAVFVWS